MNGDVLTLRVLGVYQQQNIVNTLHYRVDLQITPEHEVCQVLADGFVAQHAMAWQARHSNAYALKGVRVDRQTTGAFLIPGFTPVDLAGLDAGSEVPAAVCRTITLYCDASNPRYRGRIMLSGTTSTMLVSDTGAVIASEISDLSALGASMMLPLQASGNEYKLVLPGTQEHAVLEIVKAVGRSTPALLRSRRSREGLVG